MSFTRMDSRTEAIVDSDAGFMEFDLSSDVGYQEWRGMFSELGVKATIFNGYLVQRKGQHAQISTTPLQLHLFHEGIYLAPPFETREFYFHLIRSSLQLGKAYFKIPEGLVSLEGYKPKREELYAIDIWVTEDNTSAEEDASTNWGRQEIYTLLYEGRIKTENREYHIQRFESEQLFGNKHRRS